MGRDPEASDSGVSGRGALSFFVPTNSRSLPTEVQPAATRAIRAILDEAYAEASRTLIANLDTLRRLAAYLVEHERVDGATFDELFDGRREVPKAGDEWRAATSRPRAWGDVVDLAGRRRRPVIAEPEPEPVAVASVNPGAQPAAAAASATAAVVSVPDPAPLKAGVAITKPVVGTEPAVATALTEAVVASIEDVGAPWLSATDQIARIGRRRGRRSAARRVRHVAAGLLHRAEHWLRGSELEADRL
jgi:hypothetical protein